ncbi:hypothetical protein JCM8097_004097 [Rhodosporidiobolus ruineniae]
MARRVAYIHSEELVNAADDLPANEGRASLVHSLISSFDLLDDGDFSTGDEARAKVVEPVEASREDLCSFHDLRYVDAILGRDPDASSSSSTSGSSSDEDDPSEPEPSFGLSRPSSSSHQPPTKRRRTAPSAALGLENDCPLFPSLPSYARLVAGASMTAARLLRDGEADVAINWTGGRHHAKRGEASGFCYVADIVLAIMELRSAPRKPPPPPSPFPDPPSSSPASSPPPPPPSTAKLKRLSRILYLDLDLHHGDGPETAFFATPSVLTLSIHLHAPLFFPSSGALDSSGPENPTATGAAHALNVALEPGAGGETLERVWRTCVEKVREAYQPEAVVLQCGVDGLAGDPCKEFNLPLSALGTCVFAALEWNLPLLLLGGGGYNHPNAARAWAYLTSIALGRPLPLSSPLPPSLPSPHFAALSAPSDDLDVPSIEGWADRNTGETLGRVERAFEGYVGRVREKREGKKGGKSGMGASKAAKVGHAGGGAVESA